MAADDIRIKIGLDGVSQVQTGAKQAADSLNQVGKSQAAAGRSALLAGHQVQDFFIQIQQGQNPLTALIQQGSQLSYQFGGIGAAIKGVGALITPTVALFGGAAVALGTLALAYKQGAAETDAFARALILTGNAAGTTVGQLNEMAKAQAAVVGTQSEAAAVLTQLAASGQVAAAQIDKAADAAVRLARAGGPAADEIAKKFIELGKDPLKALIRINETENFLTKSVYETVKALDKQGKSAQAAAVAQDAYAQAVSGRGSQLEQRLGSIERGWRNVKDAATGAWSAMLNIGREDTLEEQLKKTGAQIAAQQQRLAGLRSAPQAGNLALTGGGGAASASGNIGSLRDQQSIQQSDLRLLTRAAEQQRASAIAIKQQIEADSKPKGSGGQSPYAGIISDLRKLQQVQEEELSTGGQVSDARKLQISLIDQLSDEAGKLTFAERQLVAGEIQVRVATQERIDLQRQALRAAQEIATARAAARQTEQQGIDAYIQREQQAAEASLSSLRDRAEGLELEERAVQVAASSNISLVEAIEQVTIARLREKQAGFNDTAEGQSQAAANQREIERRERLLGTLATKAAREGGERSAKELQAAFERAYNEISQGLTDALIQGGKSAADYLKGLFRTLVLRPLLEPFVGPIAGALAGVTGPAGSGAQALLGAGSFVAAGKAIYQGFSSGFGNVGSQASGLAQQFATSGIGQKFGLATLAEDAAGNIYLVPSQGASTAAGAFGTVASYAAGAAAGVYGGRAISGGFSAFGGGSGNSAVNAGTGIGAAIGSILPVLGTALGAAIGGAIGGLVNRTFGRKAPEVESRFIEGSISGGDFSGSSVTNILEKGGLFRSDRRSQDTSAITGDLDKALDEGAQQLSALAAKYGAALGLPAEQLAGVTAAIKVDITDSAEDNAKAITAALTQYSEALLGGFSADVEPLRRSGETVAQTIERVGGALLSVNDSLDLLGIQALATSIDGGKAAIALADLFGGAGNFAQASAGFYEKFYTESERADKATAQLTETLGQFGLAVPANREAYRELVQAQIELGESGFPAAAALLGLSNAFDALQTAAGETGQAIAEIARERRGLETQLLELQGNSVALRDLERNALDESNRAIYDQIKALEDQADAAKEAADAAKEAADAAEALASRQRSITSGLDGVIDDFLSGGALANYKATRIQETLAEGGIASTVPQILASTRADLTRLWETVGVDGREAILSAYGAWKDLQEILYGTQKTVDAYRGGTLAGRIEEARLQALSPAARIARLKGTEAALFGQLGTGSAEKQIETAEKLAGVIAQRFSEEAALVTDVGKTRNDALRSELDAAKQLRDVLAGIPQFTASLRFSDLSPLSARQQLAEAEKLFERTLLGAQAGDEVSIGNLQGNAQAFISEAISAFGSGQGAAAVFDRVTNALDQLAANVGPGLDPKISGLEAQLAAQETTAGNTGEMVELLLSIDRILGGRSALPASNGATEVVDLTEIAAGSGAIVTDISNGADVSDVSAKLLSLIARVDAVVTNTTPILAGVAVDREGYLQMVARLRAIEDVQTSILREITVGAVPA